MNFNDDIFFSEATKARGEFDDAESVVRDLERSIRQVNESLGRDYGPEEEFLPLDGECFEFDDSDYTYKLCPFDQVSSYSLTSSQYYVVVKLIQAFRSQQNLISCKGNLIILTHFD